VSLGRTLTAVLLITNAPNPLCEGGQSRVKLRVCHFRLGGVYVCSLASLFGV
jgi:hypothetical protein